MSLVCVGFFLWIDLQRYKNNNEDDKQERFLYIIKIIIAVPISYILQSMVEAMF